MRQLAKESTENELVRRLSLGNEQVAKKWGQEESMSKQVKKKLTKWAIS